MGWFWYIFQTALMGWFWYFDRIVLEDHNASDMQVCLFGWGLAWCMTWLLSKTIDLLRKGYHWVRRR
jgi:hypothetical protein